MCLLAQKKRFHKGDSKFIHFQKGRDVWHPELQLMAMENTGRLTRDTALHISALPPSPSHYLYVVCE